MLLIHPAQVASSHRLVERDRTIRQAQFLHFGKAMKGDEGVAKIWLDSLQLRVTPLPGVKLILPKRFSDARGYRFSGMQAFNHEI
jgi:hypothetical protein